MTTTIKECTVKTYPGANFKDAQFRYSQHTENPTSVLVLVPGSGGDGREVARHIFWINWAIKANAAIVGVRLTDIDPKIDEDYVDAKNGSGEALCKALTEFGVGELPLLMFGHSAGGGFNYEFACTYPEKVAAFIVNKGGVYYTALAPTAARAIPALFFCGMQDADYRINILVGLYTMNQVVSDSNRLPFNWDWVGIKYGGHEIGQSEVYAQDLFERVIKDRKFNR